MHSNQPSPKSPLRLELRESLIALGVVAAFFGLWLIQFFELPVLLLAFLLAMFATTIWLRSSWGVYIFMAVVFFLKVGRVAQWQRGPLRELTNMDFVFPMVLMAFAGACFRFLQVSKFGRAFHSSPNGGRDDAAEPGTGSNGGLRFPSLLGGRWWLIPAAVSLALLLLVSFPYETSTIRQYWITPRGARAIFLGSFLFFLWFFCRGVYSLIMRWKMDPQQARIQLRSTFAQEYWREQSEIESKRAKINARTWRKLE